MIEIPLDATLLAFERQLLKDPVFDEQDKDLFFQDLESPEDDIWSCPTITHQNTESHFCTLASTFSVSELHSDKMGIGSCLQEPLTRKSSLNEVPVDNEEEEQFKRSNSCSLDEGVESGLRPDQQTRFIEETVRKISEKATANPNKICRLDELFKKAIRALSHNLRKIFQDFLDGADHSKIPEAEMENILKNFLRQNYELEELKPCELLVAKQVLFSIAIKAFQVSYGPDFSEIIRKLRCEFVEVGTKKSGIAFFKTKVGRIVFWPIFRRIIMMILEEIGQNIQIKNLVKSFGRFVEKVHS